MELITGDTYTFAKDEKEIFGPVTLESQSEHIYTFSTGPVLKHYFQTRHRVIEHTPRRIGYIERLCTGSRTARIAFQITGAIAALMLFYVMTIGAGFMHRP